MFKALIAGLALCGVAGVAFAEPADGRKVAQAQCAACHDVGAGAPARREGPSFVEIAKMPSTTELSLKVFLRSSHRNMPNLILGADEVDALAAYILELGGKGRS
ncbi:MAG: cytochrome c [Methylobacteriaceae bacterium]|nr:cytochrome c [Methylobacteriaceae bacterium]